MNERRLHPFTVLRFLRKTLVVYLLPLVQVLFERNWTALHTALRQDALLFLLLCAVSWGILRVSSWSLDDTGVFHLHWRLGIRLDRALRGEMLAALTIDRPLLYRMAGASRLTLYPVGAAQKHTLSVCLPKADAEAVADQLMPLVKPTLHRPAGGERAALGFLGANGLSTLALFVLAVRQTRDVPDWNPAVFAQIQVSFLARFAARWLPAGAAWLLAAAGFLLGASLMRSFAQTVHYTVWHTADQIGSLGLGHQAIEFTKAHAQQVGHLLLLHLGLEVKQLDGALNVRHTLGLGLLLLGNSKATATQQAGGLLHLVHQLFVIVINGGLDNLGLLLGGNLVSSLNLGSFGLHGLDCLDLGSHGLVLGLVHDLFVLGHETPSWPSRASSPHSRGPSRTLCALNIHASRQNVN